MMGSLLTFCRRILGWIIFIGGSFLALAALAAGAMIPAAVLGLVAMVGLRLALRKARQPRQKKTAASSDSIEATARKPKSRSQTGGKYEDYQWGTPAPTPKQFGYACSLNVPVANGMTRDDISQLIEDALEDHNGDLPATKEQLKTIAKCHGVLPRKINQREARSVIDFLEDHYLPCPFCRIEIFASDEVCCACERSLKKLQIPIILP